MKVEYDVDHNGPLILIDTAASNVSHVSVCVSSLYVRVQL
jgi:hypothetical protein